MSAVPSNFLIGVFSQPISSFQKWKSRGINALVSHEPEGGRIKKADWEAAATAAGFWFMNYPSDDDAILQNEAKQPQRLAFTWAWHRTPERESLVTLRHEGDGGGTLLTLTHEKFFDEAARDRHRSGWADALGKLEALFA